jgi:hypothetical protein
MSAYDPKRTWRRHQHDEAIAHQTAAGDHLGVDIIANKTVEYVPLNENSDSGLPTITTGKRTVRSPRFCDWGLADDGRQIQSAFEFAHFRAAKGFTLGAGNRAPTQRPSQLHR